jgi:hypothetical protein
VKHLFFACTVLVVVGCCPTPAPHAGLGDVASCADACKHIGPQGLDCPEGLPLENGTSCQKFCEDTIGTGHALNPSCIVSVKTCSDIEKLCTR